MARPENGYWRDGVHIVSNTEALSATRVRRWSGNKTTWDRRARIGSAVHIAAAILDCNNKTWDDAPREWIEPYDAVSPEVRGFCLAWERCKREEQIVVKLVEHSLFAKVDLSDFATTVDRVGLRRGEPAIIELKTPKAAEPYWGIQLAGQELAVIANLGPPTARPFRYQRWAAQLFATGKYKLIPYSDPQDFVIFRQSLNIAIWNANNYGN